MHRKEIMYLIVANGVLLILILEHLLLHLELAKPLALFWGIGTLVLNIVTIYNKIEIKNQG